VALDILAYEYHNYDCLNQKHNKKIY
jgi:hypothetical protein